VPRTPPAYAPRRWLGGFTRISLAPGEKRRIRIPFAANALTMVDEAGARHPLSGDVDIAVGGRQPGRDGRSPDDTAGVTTPVPLGSP